MSPLLSTSEMGAPHRFLARLFLESAHSAYYSFKRTAGVGLR